MAQVTDAQSERDSLQRRLLRRGKRVVELQRLLRNAGLAEAMAQALLHADRQTAQAGVAELQDSSRPSWQTVRQRAESMASPEGSGGSALVLLRLQGLSSHGSSTSASPT